MGILPISVSEPSAPYPEGHAVTGAGAHGRTSSGRDFLVDGLLIRQLQENSRIPIFANAILAVAVAYIMRDVVAGAILASWLSVVLILNVVRYFYFNHRSVESLTSAEQIRWAWQFTFGVGILGTVWGFGGILFFASEAHHLQMFMAFVLGGMSAGAVASYASWLPAYYAYSVLSMTPLAARFFMEPGDMSVMMGAMLALFLIFVCMLAKSFNGSMKQMFSLREEKTRLLDERDISERFFSRAFHSSPALMSVSSPNDGHHFDVNETWSAITGYDREEAMATTATQLGLWEKPKERDAFIRELEKYGSVRGCETVFQTKSGEKLDMLVAGEYINVGDEKRLLFIGQDITRLKEVERLKSEFVGIVSHELRTPLTAIKGSLGLIIGGAAGSISDQSKELLLRAKKNTTRLETLVNDILDFERLQTGKMEFNFAECNMADLIRKTVRQCAPYADDFDVILNVEPLPEDIIVTIDSERISQVLDNIISNAVKFSPAGDKVTISMKTTRNGLRVSIADNGPGIKEDFQYRVFERFAQEDASDTRSNMGSGLGLSISKTIIDRHNGIIGLESWVDIGSTFYFELNI